MGRKVMVDMDDLETIESFLECDDTREALKILQAVLKELGKAYEG